ncbi:MAG: hypothetical protein FRX49_12648 [Trebouxia sp. A1-2]|nr:MAG: hypothetical protein FRX49_12648 [Trebouxia sp. A1-2]
MAAVNSSCLPAGTWTPSKTGEDLAPAYSAERDKQLHMMSLMCWLVVPGPSQGNSPCRLQDGPSLVEDILDCGACGCIVDQQDSITQLSTQVEAFCTWLLDGNTISKDINML